MIISAHIHSRRQDITKHISTCIGMAQGNGISNGKKMSALICICINTVLARQNNRPSPCYLFTIYVRCKIYTLTNIHYYLTGHPVRHNGKYVNLGLYEYIM